MQYCRNVWNLFKGIAENDFLLQQYLFRIDLSKIVEDVQKFPLYSEFLQTQQ